MKKYLIVLTNENQEFYEEVIFVEDKKTAKMVSHDKVIGLKEVLPNGTFSYAEPVEVK